MAIIRPVFSVAALCAVLTSFAAASAWAQTPAPQAPREPPRLTIYPLLVNATVFGASVDVPDDPNGGGGGVSGSTSFSWNAAYMGGVQVQYPNWFADANGTWAAVSGSRQTPFTTIDTHLWLINARTGVRVVGRLFATGGLRRAVADLDVQLTRPTTSSVVPVDAKRGFWDPMVGVDWRGQAGAFDIVASLQGGGFGVGTDVDVMTDLHADWHVAPHFGIRFGYQATHYKWTIADATVAGVTRTLVSKQTLHGPSLGFALTF